MDLSKMDILKVTNVNKYGQMKAFDTEGEIKNIETIIITIPTDDVVTALVTTKDRIRRYILSRIDVRPVSEFGKVIGGKK